MAGLSPAQGPGAGPAQSFVCSRVFWRLRFGSTLDPRALMLKERRKDSLALAGGRGWGCCLGLYLADAPTKQDPALTHSSWIKAAMKLGGPLEIKRSPLPKCTGEETEAPETKLSPLFSRGNDSGESALPQTQATQPGSQASLGCPASAEWLASQLCPSLSRRHLSQAPLILISLG